MANKITGRVEVLVNGQSLLNKVGAKIGGIGVNGQLPVKRTAVTGDSGVHGYVEEVIIPYCEVKLTDRSDILISQLTGIKETGTIIFRAAGGGKVYTMNEATCTGETTVTSGEGEVEIRFEGKSWIESSSDT